MGMLLKRGTRSGEQARALSCSNFVSNSLFCCHFSFSRSPFCSLRSRRLEEVGARKNGRARGRHALAPVLSRAHYLQAAVLVTSNVVVYKNPCFLKCFLFSRRCIVDYIQSNLINFVAWIERNRLKYRHPKCHLQFRFNWYET